MPERAVLAGDIGGTKTTLALFSPAGELIQEETFKNKLFGGLPELVATFLDNPGSRLARACFGVAGPVHNNRVRMTNLDWTIDGGQLADKFAIDRVLLVNDLVATTAGAAILPADSLITINIGRTAAGGSIGVLAPGTGLGEAFAVPVINGMKAFPSEGGHSSFAPRNEEQIGLLKFMLKKRNHVSVEQVCSGMVIPELYRFMSTCCPEPPWLAEQLAAADDRTPIIVAAANHAMEGGTACETAVRTLQLFVDILAAEAANLALKVLATGGIYIGGGMPPRMLHFFDQQRFMDFFCRGVYRDMLSNIPIHIIRDPKTALLGAREIAMAEG
jgi:glucokinase